MGEKSVAKASQTEVTQNLTDKTTQQLVTEIKVHSASLHACLTALIGRHGTNALRKASNQGRSEQGNMP